jgi:hypothetical protein
MIDDSGANLRGRSEFIASLDIADLREKEWERLRKQAECNHEALQLDNLWEKSILPQQINDASEKLGSLYIQTNKIGPRLDRHTDRPRLPLRLGARVREVSIIGNPESTIQAVRGQLLMHRTENNGVLQETGFFVLLSKSWDNKVPRLTYGRIDAGNDEPDNRSHVMLEVLLSTQRDFLFDLTITDLEVQRELIADFNPIDILAKMEERARVEAMSTDKPWQEVYKKMVESRISNTDDLLAMIDKLFETRLINRRFKRDKKAIGVLSQHAAPYVDGQDCSQVAAGLQYFFDDVHEPMQTRPDQKHAALQDLEHGTQLEKIDPYQITEVDLARSVVRNWNKLGRSLQEEILQIPKNDFPYSVENRLALDYSKYPELKKHIDEFMIRINQAELEKNFPGIGEVIESQDRSKLEEFRAIHPDLTMHTVVNNMNTFQLYKGENSTMFGIDWSSFDRLMRELAQIEVKPSPLAFPYD